MGQIRFRSGYDGVALGVIENGVSILELIGIDPDPMGPNDIQYTGTLNLAQTPQGLRLV